MTKEEAKEYLNNYRKMYAELAPERFLEALDIMLNEPSLPSNLDEAAEECTQRLIPETELPPTTPFSLEYVIEMLYKTFKAGAEWMAGQGCSKEARVWVLGKDETPAVGVDDAIYLPKNLFERGDKVIIQVRKNEAILRDTKVKSLTSTLDLERRNDESEDAIQNA